jgi:hypothetical protein
LERVGFVLTILDLVGFAALDRAACFVRLVLLGCLGLDFGWFAVTQDLADDCCRADAFNRTQGTRRWSLVTFARLLVNRGHQKADFGALSQCSSGGELSGANCRLGAGHALCT